ncbi:ABC transporter substrate-binding protein [Sinorhizobium medicae]|nr:ABC transporter substrate-binding protein [Sinorhizobium medicae]
MKRNANRRTVLKQLATAAVMSGLPLGGTQPAHALNSDRRKLKVAVQDLRTVLEPMHPQSAAVISYRVQYNIYDGLLTLDYLNDFAVTHALATSFKQIDDRTYEFSLRPGVQFHDGSEMTADDVAFSFGPTRLLDKSAPGRSMKNQFLPTLKSAEAVDALTVRLSTSVADPVFLKRLATWGGQVISRKAFEAAGDFEKWSVRPVGTGPFRVDETSPDRFIRLVAHDDYWGGAPTASGVEFLKVAELSARVAGLLSNDYDIVTDITPDQISSIERDRNFAVVGGEVAVFRSVNIDTNNPQLSDVKLRQAMSFAIDRRVIVDTLWAGKVTVPKGEQLPFFGELFDPNRAAPVFDPDRARMLVKQSSYKGEAIPYRMLQGYYTNELATAQALVSMWKAVGINVEIVLKENWAQVYEKPATGLNNDSCPMLYPDPLSTLWRCYGDTSGYQADEKSWANGEFNKLGNSLETSSGPEARRRIFQRMLDIVDEEDPPSILLHTMAYLYGIRKDVHWRPYSSAPMDFRPNNLAFSA